MSSVQKDIFQTKGLNEFIACLYNNFCNRDDITEEQIKNLVEQIKQLGTIDEVVSCLNEKIIYYDKQKNWNDHYMANLLISLLSSLIDDPKFKDIAFSTLKTLLDGIYDKNSLMNNYYFQPMKHVYKVQKSIATSLCKEYLEKYIESEDIKSLNIKVESLMTILCQQYIRTKDVSILDIIRNIALNGSNAQVSIISFHSIITEGSSSKFPNEDLLELSMQMYITPKITVRGEMRSKVLSMCSYYHRRQQDKSLEILTKKFKQHVDTLPHKQIVLSMKGILARIDPEYTINKYMDDPASRKYILQATEEALKKSTRAISMHINTLSSHLLWSNINKDMSKSNPDYNEVKESILNIINTFEDSNNFLEQVIPYPILKVLREMNPYAWRGEPDPELLFIDKFLEFSQKIETYGQPIGK